MREVGKKILTRGVKIFIETVMIRWWNQLFIYKITLRWYPLYINSTQPGNAQAFVLYHAVTAEQVILEQRMMRAQLLSGDSGSGAQGTIPKQIGHSGGPDTGLDTAVTPVDLVLDPSVTSVTPLKAAAAVLGDRGGEGVGSAAGPANAVGMDGENSGPKATP